MELKKIAFELEDLQCEAEKVESLHLALIVAVYNGSYDLKEYEWAFQAVNELIHGLTEGLAALVKCSFEEMKRE